MSDSAPPSAPAPDAPPPPRRSPEAAAAAAPTPADQAHSRRRAASPAQRSAAFARPTGASPGSEAAPPPADPRAARRVAAAQAGPERGAQATPPPRGDAPAGAAPRPNPTKKAAPPSAPSSAGSTTPPSAAATRPRPDRSALFSAEKTAPPAPAPASAPAAARTADPGAPRPAAAPPRPADAARRPARASGRETPPAAATEAPSPARPDPAPPRRASARPADPRAAILAAARDALAKDGPAGLDLPRLRAEVGLDPAPSPGDPFPDPPALRAALAVEGFDRLGAALRRDISAATPSRVARAEAALRSYVGFATAHPGLFATMFPLHPPGPVPDATDSAVAAAMGRALAPLHEIAADLELPTRLAPLEDGRSPGLYLWTLAHGHAALALCGAYGAEARTPLDPAAWAEGGRAQTDPASGTAAREAGVQDAATQRDAAAQSAAPVAPPDLRRIAPRMRFFSPYQFESMGDADDPAALAAPRRRS